VERLVDDSIERVAEREGVTPEEAGSKMLRVQEQTTWRIESLEEEGLSADEAIDTALRESNEPTS
jgi:hypothetical protein